MYSLVLNSSMMWVSKKVFVGFWLLAIGNWLLARPYRGIACHTNNNESHAGGIFFALTNSFPLTLNLSTSNVIAIVEKQSLVSFCIS
jgi:hypothetical protein